LNRRTIIVVLSVVTCIIIASSLIFFFMGLDKKDVHGGYDVPNYNQIRHDMVYQKEVQFDSEVLKRNILSDPCYSDYMIKDEYSMVYQITDAESEEMIKEYLGIKSDLPDIDYDSNYLLVSVGRPIVNMKSGLNNETLSGESVLEIVYSDDEYRKDCLFVYSMNKTKIVSGERLERYLWENNLPASNFYQPEEDTRQIVSEGKYHRLYKKSTGSYECALLTMDEGKINKRLFSQNEIKVTEFDLTLVKIDYGTSNVYYNVPRGVFSEEYAFNTEYLIYNIISYMRVKDGKLQLILRDAYDSTFYAKIITLPFTYDLDNIDSLVQKVTVVDNTHVSVEYYKGENRELVKETVEVYSLNR